MKQKKHSEASCFTPFKGALAEFILPKRFNFPFYYTPDPICVLAATELQEHIENQTDWQHNFGLNENQEGLVIGKMFGVLVVENKQGEIGYLAGFSGKLAGENHHPKFVPPVFDILEKDGFFRKGEAIVSKINASVEELENAEDFCHAKQFLEDEKAQASLNLNAQRQIVQEKKKARKIKRNEAISILSSEEYTSLLEILGKESVEQHYIYKDLANYWKDRIAEAENQLSVFTQQIDALKEERKTRSAAIQQQIFEHYTFLNQAGETKDLCQIFEHTSDINPPAGAGECAAPKLLQYAFLHQLKPISIAEFWWGKSPGGEIRKHGSFYPACRGKCEPILGHMLAGMEIDENPMLTNPALGKELETIFEDDYLAVISKPAEFLSVPGINIQDSVYDRMKLKYPEAKGPLVVHRLDMSTSGLMLIAKTKEVHKSLQRQFINRSVKKQYIALLDGIISENEGIIDLPLRVDLDNRPQQMVCEEHGKRAITHWKVLERNANTTRIQFSPITGRTHQLRVHAAHPRGLNTAILGDDLYGKIQNRLHLHAESITFRHPISAEIHTFCAPAEF